MSGHNYNNNTLFQRIVHVQTNQPIHRPIVSVPVRYSSNSQNLYVQMEDIYRELEQPYDIALFFDPFGTIPVNDSFDSHIPFYPDRFLYYCEVFNINQYPTGHECTCAQCASSFHTQTYHQRQIGYQEDQQQQQQQYQGQSRSHSQESASSTPTPIHQYPSNFAYGTSHQCYGQSTAYGHSNSVYGQLSGDRTRAALDDLVQLDNNSAEESIVRPLPRRDAIGYDDDGSYEPLEHISQPGESSGQGSTIDRFSDSGSPWSSWDYQDKQSQDNEYPRPDAPSSPSARFYARSNPQPPSPSLDY
ncbi:hypothetical protein BG015_003768 [Linnemannia schmuckeri]|uniref:Uncharacterized protein n=1 Tax=Linnemannia schmuckeri TaxID=64567 RepID=A0A9P5S4T5_9FUNG|nr:hypothetical protein BG015_003768 [Linnemannia schmuckeri]